MQELAREVDRIKRLPTAADRRAHLNEVLGPRTTDKTRLDFNARLITALRVANVKVWES